LYKSWSPGVRWGHNGGKPFLHVFVLEKKSFTQNQQANFNQTWYKSSPSERNLELYKSRARFSSKRDNHKNSKVLLSHLKVFLSIINNLEKLRFT
jgi:hypothetical protein